MGIRIIDLPIASNSTNTDVLPIVQGGTTKRVQKSIFLNEISTSINELNNEMEETNTKLDEAIAEFTSPLTYEGEVLNKSDLPLNAEKGDIYNVTSENKNYIWNGTTWIEYAATIDLTYLEKTIQETTEAEKLEITDSANALASLEKVSGNTEQATRDGKNLLNIYDLYEVGYTTTKNGVTFTILENGGIKVNGTPTTNTSIPIMGVYQSAVPIIVFDGDYVQSGVSDTISILYFNGTTSFANMFNNDTLNLHNNCDYAIFSVRKNIVYDNVIVYPQLEQGTTPTEYEKYGASPSPDYPSDIRNVGDNVNSVDIKNSTRTINGMTFTVNPDKSITVVGTASGAATFHLNTSNNVLAYSEAIQPGNYILNGCADGSDSTYFLQLVLQNANSHGQRYFNCRNTPINIDVDNANNYAIAIYVRDGVTVNKTFYPKLEKGSVVTPYTQYNYGSADIKVENKNICNKVELQGSNNIKFYFDNKIINKTHVLSFTPNVELSNNSLYLRVDNVDLGKVKFVTAAANNRYFTSITLTDEQYEQVKNAFQAYYLLYKPNAGFTLPTDGQIENGSIVSDYTEHKEQVIQFPFINGQVLHEGDYLAEDGIHQVRKTLVFDGTENTWSLMSLSFILADTNVKRSYHGISSHFIAQTNNQWVSSDETYRGKFSILNEDNKIKFMPNDSSISTLALWKSWLAEQHANGTPVTVEYELKEEVVIPYTEEQQEAYYKLTHFLTYKGYTLIGCMDSIKPMIQAEYLYNNGMNNYYGNMLYLLENKIYELEKKIGG